jgi:glucokinase
MNFGKFITEKNGRIISSVLLGLGLATLFRQICKGKNCVVEHAVPMSDITDKVYKYDNKCYKYTSVPVKCDQNKKRIKFA